MPDDDYKPDIQVETVPSHGRHGPLDNPVEDPNAPDVALITAEDTKSESFAFPLTPTIGGVTLRPLRASSLALLRMAKNPLIDGGDIPDLEYHVLSFVFIHSARRGDVLAALTSPEKYRDAVLKFGDYLTISDFGKAAQDVKAMIQQAAKANDFQVEDKGLSPPNASTRAGSPGTSA